MHLSLEDALGRIQPVTVLAGPNGCGKTSVLFAIVQALRGLFKYRADDVPEPTDLDIHRSENGAYYSRTPPRMSVQLQMEFSEDEKTAIRTVWQETEPLRMQHDEMGAAKAVKPNTSPALPLPNWTGTAVTVDWGYPQPLGADGERRPFWFADRVVPREALHWFEGRVYAIRAVRRGLLSDPRLLDRIGGPLLFPQDRSLRTRVTGRTPVPEQAESDLTVWDILKDLGQRATSPSLDDAATHGRPKDEALRSEERIKKLFAQICGPKEYLGFVYTPSDPSGSPYFKEGKSHYPLALASSGEQVILEYIVRLTFPNTLNRGLILIDEPEVHLHPGWVRQLYRALPMLGEENQFIVTTHSAELREMAASDGVLIDLGDLQR